MMHFPKTISPSVLDGLQRGSSALEITKEGTFTIARKDYKKQSHKTLDLFLSSLEEMKKHPDSATQSRRWEILHLGDLYLDNLVRQHQKELDKGLAGCKGRSLLLKIAKFDRYLAAAKIKEGCLQSREVSKLYKTRVSQDLLQKWLAEPTHRARKGKKEEFVVEGLAQEAFFQHPEEVDFIMENYLHKQVARHNEHIYVHAVTKQPMLRSEGSFQTVDKIRERWIGKEGKLYAKEGECRGFYRQGQGISKFDPTRWSELPVFAKRNHFHGSDDYKLVVKTVVSKSGKHAWIELKDPQYKYNVGFFWQEGEETEYWNLCQTVKGMLHVADKHEYLGEEKDTKKVAFKITKEQFIHLKQSIEKFQADPSRKMFNLINSNCTSWVRNLLAEIGIRAESQASFSEAYLGLSGPIALLRKRVSKVKWVWTMIYTVTSVVRNLFIYLLGGGYNRENGVFRDKNNPNDRAVPTVLHVFNPAQGSFDHPKVMSEWQDKLMEARKKMIEEEQEKVKKGKVYPFLPKPEQMQMLDSVAQDLKYAVPKPFLMP